MLIFLVGLFLLFLRVHRGFGFAWSLALHVPQLRLGLPRSCRYFTWHRSFTCRLMLHTRLGQRTFKSCRLSVSIFDLILRCFNQIYIWPSLFAERILDRDGITVGKWILLQVLLIELLVHMDEVCEILLLSGLISDQSWKLFHKIRIHVGRKLLRRCRQSGNLLPGSVSLFDSHAVIDLLRQVKRDFFWLLKLVWEVFANVILIALIVDVGQCLGVRASQILVSVESCNLGPEFLSIVSFRCEDCVGKHLCAWSGFVVDGCHIRGITNIVLRQGFFVLEMRILEQLPTVEWISKLGSLIIKSTDRENVCTDLAIAIVAWLTPVSLSSWCFSKATSYRSQRCSTLISPVKQRRNLLNSRMPCRIKCLIWRLLLAQSQIFRVLLTQSRSCRQTSGWRLARQLLTFLIFILWNAFAHSHL